MKNDITIVFEYINYKIYCCFLYFISGLTNDSGIRVELASIVAPIRSVYGFLYI